MTQTSNGSITITDLTDITDVYLQYCMAVDSITTAAAITAKTTWTPPERGWSTEYPTWQSGYQIWIREVTKKEGIAQLKYGTPYLDKAVNQINNNISNIQTKIKKIWSDSTGSYMASGISGNDVTESNVNTYGFNSKSTTTGISFNYNAIPLTTLGTDGLKLYSPVLTNSIITGNRLDATLTSEGLKLLRGGIEAGTKNTSDYIYVYSHDDATNHTLAINNSGNKSDWRIIAGKNFGVDKAGNLYANEAHINGEITATSLTIESKAPVSGLSTSNIDGMNNYALQKSLDSEITQRKAIYAVSTTEATIAEKTTELGTPSGFVLYNGATVTVKFDNGNSTTTPTLNVNGTGAKTIKSYTGAALTEAEYTWPAGVTVTFTYDGSYWRMQDSGALQAKADAAAAKSDAATAQSTADTAKKNAATAKAGVDTLNTYIRSCDDGVEVARKDANGNYIGYKSIQTADGLEIRTADDVVVARYGNYVKIGEDSTSQVLIDSQTLQIITKLYNLYALSVKTRNIDTSTEEPVEFEKIEGNKVAFADSISFSVSVDPAPGGYYSLADFIIYANDGRYHATMGVQSGTSKTETITAQKEIDDIGGGTVSGSLTFTAAYDGAKTFTLSNFSTSDIESVEWHVSYTVLSTEVPEVRIQGDSYLSGRLGVSTLTGTVDITDGNVSLTGIMEAEEGITTNGTITIKYKDIREIFSGIISVGFEDKSLSIAAGGNTGEATINLSKAGYSARCICGWNLSGTGSSNCVIPKLFINQTNQQLHFYVKNTGSSKATPTLRIYVLYTKNN